MIKNTAWWCILAAALMVAVGCGKEEVAPQGVTKGTVVNDTMTIDEQIAKIQNDPNIPDSYKQSFINSLRAKAAAQPAGGPTAPPPTNP